MVYIKYTYYTYYRPLYISYHLVISIVFQNYSLIISRNSNKISINSRSFTNSVPTLWNSLPPNICSIIYHSRVINLTPYLLSTSNR